MRCPPAAWTISKSRPSCASRRTDRRTTVSRNHKECSPRGVLRGGPRKRPPVFLLDALPLLIAAITRIEYGRLTLASKLAPMLQQRTLTSLTRAVGVGLHSGQRVELTLRPAQPDTGIVFRRTDLPIPVDIPVSAYAVNDTRLASTITNGNVKVHTVEHLMSACAGLGIDNAYIDITGEEVPILDGSSASFVLSLFLFCRCRCFVVC